MGIHLLVAAPVMLLCLILQGIGVAICLRYYAGYRKRWEGRESLWIEITLLMAIMLLTLLCNIVQIVIWAALFMMLGEFKTLMPAVYHSSVNFATLGYGDIVMSERWRMLGPIEAANGILMFGMSTSVMTAAVLDVIKSNMARLRGEASP